MTNTNRVVFNGTTENFLKTNALGDAKYTGHCLYTGTRENGGWDEAIIGDSYVYVKSTKDNKKTVSVIIPNACEEETLELLKQFEIELFQKGENKMDITYQEIKKMLKENNLISDVFYFSLTEKYDEYSNKDSLIASFSYRAGNKIFVSLIKNIFEVFSPYKEIIDTEKGFYSFNLPYGDV